jgi:hypothetical protein
MGSKILTLWPTTTTTAAAAAYGHAWFGLSR